MSDLVSPTGKDIIVAPVRPNVGIEMAYQARLDTMISRMQADIIKTIDPIYAASQPEIAQDASPSILLRNAMRRLGVKWQARFDALAPELAAYFVTAASRRADATLKANLRKAGFTVRFQMTPEVRNIVQAEIAENVSLIKSIPSQHFTQIEGHVMRSVAAGRDLGSLAKTLHEQYGVTKRRAAFIATDQNNKATANVVTARQQELGIEDAEWLHSAGGHQPRPAHVAFSGKRYNIKTGAYIEGEFIRPGQKIRCRCVSKSIIPGFSSLRRAA